MTQYLPSVTEGFIWSSEILKLNYKAFAVFPKSFSKPYTNFSPPHSSAKNRIFIYLAQSCSLSFHTIVMTLSLLTLIFDLIPLISALVSFCLF